MELGRSCEISTAAFGAWEQFWRSPSASAPHPRSLVPQTTEPSANTPGHTHSRPGAHAGVDIPRGVCAGDRIYPRAGDGYATRGDSHTCTFSKPRFHDKCPRSDIYVTGHTYRLLPSTHFQPGIKRVREGQECFRSGLKADGVREKP